MTDPNLNDLNLNDHTTLPFFNKPHRTSPSVPRGYITVILNVFPYLSMSERMDCDADTVVEALELLAARVRARVLAAR